ncbi:MAG: acetamidase/formamidase family protein [Gammaproteobacteria bacterium]|jgi:formamidase|nr:acetamidase/formamidase family protein [Gammaproteobacteria bacterium]HJO12289.1 acetamidase/formamidase family protein [Gammaproteobacteria bacterium]|tara:strand:- start:1159 stop:2412 length:1254 start_codon:yes stop_codon:yes gene_type:complete
MIKIRSSLSGPLACVISILLSGGALAAENNIVVVGGEGVDCVEDPGCVNRLHPDIPMAARARPGQTILFRARDARDVLGAAAAQTTEPETLSSAFGRVHPITGPVYIEGAVAGDVLKVTINNIDPGSYAYTSGGSSGFIPDLVDGQSLVIWRLNRNYAETDDIPGIRIPNSSFPGIVTTMPGPNQLRLMLEREQELADAGGRVSLPMADGADPVALCGPNGSASDQCLRTIPPREHGGNMDIRYLQAGVSIYLPCFIDGCGLAIGDLHYAQGDGEVSGTAIEMSADVWATTEILKDGPDLSRGPHYEGPAQLLDIPSRRFYAVTGIPIKDAGDVPPNMRYLNSDVVAPLQNLPNDINLAARNAIDGIIDYITSTYGYNRQQAYVIASVAVDIRIGQLVDAPNVGVTAVLPLDIFTAD